MLSPSQSRAARALIEWSQEQLAAASHLGLSTIRDFEKGRRIPTHNNLAGIRAALEAAGIVFLPAGELVPGGPGVRLGIKAASAADLTQKIDELERQMRDGGADGTPSPDEGMRRLEQARNTEIVGRLKKRRAEIKKGGE